MESMMIISGTTARNFLDQFMPVSLKSVLTVLGRIRTMAAIYQVYGEIYPERVKEKLGDPQNWFTTGLKDPEQVEHSFLSALGELFPIEEDATYEMLFGDFSENGYGGFYVTGLGPCLSWDVVDEILGDLDSADETLSLPLFFGAIGNGFDKEQWKMLAQRFRWPFRTAPDLPEGDWYFSPTKAKRLLLRHGMKRYWSAWQVASESTGILFFDVNPNDETNIPELIEATPENLRTLARLWRRKGTAMFEEYIAALKEAAAHPRVLKQLFKLMMRSVVIEQKNKPGKGADDYERHTE